MNQGQARRWIERHYGNQKRYEASRQNPPSEAETLAALTKVGSIRVASRALREALERFLYEGCRRYDRWFAPSPSSVPMDYRHHFRRFAEALQKTETRPVNSPVFLIHAIRDDLYAEFNGIALPLSTEQRTKLDSYQSQLASVKTPHEHNKAQEVYKERLELVQIIEGLSGGTLRSHLRTSLPYMLTRQAISFSSVWKTVRIEGRLIPSCSPPSSTLVQVEKPLVMAPRTATRWQYGLTTVDLEFAALIDPSIQVPSLQVPDIKVPIDAWPNGLQLAFDVIYETCWALRSQTSYIGLWIPAPGDLGDIESWSSTPKAQQINYIRRGHPSMLYECFLPPTATLAMNLGTYHRSEWHQRCRVLAEQYAMFGETREALFWLNVGVEALLKLRMERQIAATGASLDLNKLDGADAYWDEAKQAVAARFPELVDEIEWPRRDQKPSLFRQLKFFCREIPGAPEFNAARTKYAAVSRKRNALFHGENEDPISIDDVRTAIDGFVWLIDNFCPSTTVPNNHVETTL